jgi:hypothetical protein
MSAGSALPHQHTALQQEQQGDSALGGNSESSEHGEVDKSSTNVNKLKNEADGSWKRQVSSFRNWIEEGGDFPPEKGNLSNSQLQLSRVYAGRC